MDMPASVTPRGVECDECGKREVHGSRHAPITNARGLVVGFFCGECCDVALSIVRQVNRLHGAHYSNDGTMILRAPVGTPHYRSLRSAREYLRERGHAHT